MTWWLIVGGIVVWIAAVAFALAIMRIVAKADERIEQEKERERR